MKTKGILTFVFCLCVSFVFGQLSVPGGSVGTSSNGNVGINTTSPTDDLHIQTTGSPASFLLERTDGVYLKATAGFLGGAFYFKDTGRFAFSPTSSTGANVADFPNALMIFGSNHATHPGKMAFGTATPGDAKFTLNGKFLCEEAQVVNDVEAPDYVFKDDYYLRSLDEVEMYINENSHLPEIPSAAEFKKEGIHLGQMSFDLLKKVEELTLYMIEMKKENTALKARIENLESSK